MLPKIRLKLRDFFKKYGKIIIIVLAIWAVIVVINYFLKAMPEPEKPLITTYKPHTAVMDDTTVPQKLQSPIENIINQFIDACNNKNYEEAYNLLSEDCKNDVFPKMDDLKIYVDSVFDEKKIYNIQNFSNKDGYYIYTVTILNDIMKSGLTNEELSTYEETFVLKEEKGALKLSIKGYIENAKVDKMYEDEYIKVTIENVVVDYETVTYFVKISNKTDYIMVLDNSTEKYEIVLDTDKGYRHLNGLFLEPVVLSEQTAKTFKLKFARFYDETGNINALIFNKVRILKSYTGTEETRQSELDNAFKIYSFKIDL